MLIRQLELMIAREYKKANREIGHKADDYFKRYETKDKIKRDQLRRGIITKEEYVRWRTGQLLVGSRWEEMRNTLAQDYHHANLIANQAIIGGMPEIYALNHSYGTFLGERESLVDTSYTLYSRDTIEAILNETPLLPAARKHGAQFEALTSIEYAMPELGKTAAKRIAEGRDVLWNVQEIQSVMMQGILQGLSIPSLANKLEDVTDRNHKAAIRNARTMATNVQNAGRQAAFERLKRKGIRMKKTWVATLDGRTRHEHRILNGQTVDIDEPFTVDGMEIDFPGDPHAKARLVYNCRCTMISQFEGFERDVNALRNDPDLGGMTYEEWVEAKATSDPIEKQEWIANIMKGKYMRDYRR